MDFFTFARALLGENYVLVLKTVLLEAGRSYLDDKKIEQKYFFIMEKIDFEKWKIYIFDQNQ